MVLSSDDGISLRCGDSVLEITKDGIKVNGTNIALAGSKSVTMKGNGPSISLGDEGTMCAKSLNFVGEKSSLALGKDAKLDGAQVKLNCGSMLPSSPKSNDGGPKTKKVCLKLAGADGKPHANKEYILTAGGARFEGSTDGDGKVEKDVPKEAEVAQIVLYIGARPEGETIRYRVALEEMPADSIKSTLTRLKNHGFYWGEPSENLDSSARDAIRAFKKSAGIDPADDEITDELKSKLTD